MRHKTKQLIMSKIEKDKISSAYHDSKNIYDGVLTQGNIFARAYIKFFWGGTDDVAIAPHCKSQLIGIAQFRFTADFCSV